MRYYALQVLDQNNNTTFKEIEKLKTKLFTKTLKAYLLKKYIIAFIQDDSPNRLKTPLFPLYILIINEIVLTEK